MDEWAQLVRHGVITTTAISDTHTERERVEVREQQKMMGFRVVA